MSTLWFWEVEAPHLDDIMRRYSDMGQSVRASLRREMTAILIEVQARVQEKLSGEVLSERTHRLHDSVHSEITETDTSIVGRTGTQKIPYAHFWEYGFHGTESVREHTRLVTMAFGRTIEPRETTVRAHIRRVDQNARSYLRSTLAEKRDRIEAGLDRAYAAGAAGAGAP